MTNNQEPDMKEKKFYMTKKNVELIEWYLEQNFEIYIENGMYRLRSKRRAVSGSDMSWYLGHSKTFMKLPNRLFKND